MVATSDLFDECLRRISPSEVQLDTARRHRDAVQSRLRIEGMIESLNSGSYIKRTAIKPFEDIDLFVGIDPKAYDGVPERVITRAAFHLRNSFPASAVRVQTHSVGVTFSDDFRVDVVPGFAVRNLPGYYRVRNRDDGRWVMTNIQLHKEFFQRRYDSDGRFRDLVKLVKHWKNARRMRMGSYLMELLVAKCFQDGIPKGKDVALHTFFNWVARGGLDKPIVFHDYYRAGEIEHIPNAPLVVLDPTNVENNVASGLTAKAVAEIVNVADYARARSGTALLAGSRRQASAAWRDILPDFPPA